MDAISNLFSRFGAPAKTKLVLLANSDVFSAEVLNHLRSLNIEHVSPAVLVQQEISRHTPFGLKAESVIKKGLTLPEEAVLATLRRWFWTRKPDAGFVLSGFPATLLQAKVFDEWLEARDETLFGVVVDPAFSSPLVDHYRTLGLVLETSMSA